MSQNPPLLLKSNLKQLRLPAHPGNKTDDTDLAAIQRAAVNGFGLIEPAGEVRNRGEIRRHLQH